MVHYNDSSSTLLALPSLKIPGCRSIDPQVGKTDGLVPFLRKFV